MSHHMKRAMLLESPRHLVDVVIDTDAYNEIDDQFALAYALRAKDKLSVKALYAAPFLNKRSVSPKDGMEKSYQEIRKLLMLAEESIPVFRGADRFLLSESDQCISDAAVDICTRAMNYSAEDPLYVIAIGAITNIASSLLKNAEIAKRIVVVWLGGNSLEWHDNKEFNMLQDVAAARIVMGSGVPLILVPCMGVVESFRTTGQELEYWLKGKNKLCDYLVNQTIEEANQYAKGRVWSRVIWDVTAVGWLLNENSLYMLDKLIPTPIPEYDHYYAMDPRRQLCKYVYHIKRDALMADLFTRLAHPN